LLDKKYRPNSLYEIVGQEHLLSDGKPLRVLITKRALKHSFFYGPSGSGKTTLAKVIASIYDLPYHEFNATSFSFNPYPKKYRM